MKHTSYQTLKFDPDQLGTIFYQCVEKSLEAVMITDITGRLIYVNQAWQSIYGYSSEEAIGQTPRLLRSSRQSDLFYIDMWQEIMSSSRMTWAGRLVNQAKSGKEVPVYLTISPWLDSRGVHQGFMGLAIDLSERIRLEEQLLHQDRLATLGFLSSGLAHEIGSPLSVIRGRAEYMSTFTLQDSRVFQGLSVIIQQIDRISRLIQALLNIARQSPSRSAVGLALRSTLEETISLLSRELMKQSISVDLDVDSGTKVLAESGQLDQIFINLLMNSIYSIKLKKRESSQSFKGIIRICSEIKNNKILITVFDNGIGITEDDQKNIFKPFFTTKPRGEGTGLGLAIVQQIVSGWGGCIALHSVSGKNCTVSIELKNGNDTRYAMEY